MKWFILLGILPLAVSAETIEEIRDLYSRVNSSLENGDLYRTDIEINSEGSMYPAVGVYGRSISFYWGLNPDSYPDSQLLFIRINSEYSAIEEFEEYLYSSSGELVFYFMAGGYEQVEERYYFSNSNLQRYICDDEQTDRPDGDTLVNGERILRESEKLFQAFTLIH